MSYIKLQDNIVKQLPIDKIKYIILVLTRKKIVNIWEKNIASPIQSKKENMLIAKN